MNESDFKGEFIMAMKTNRATTVRVFDSKTAADQAVADFRAAGYRDDQIGMIYRNTSGKAVRTDGAGDNNAAEGAVAGATAGALAGAAVGAGVLAGVIPVIGPVLALGTLGTILVNAAGGAAIAGIAGALIGWGVPAEDAEYYEGEVAAGKYLVTVTPDDNLSDPNGIFVRHGGYDRMSDRSAGRSPTRPMSV
jgi:hypothetical protein